VNRSFHDQGCTAALKALMSAEKLGGPVEVLASVRVAPSMPKAATQHSEPLFPLGPHFFAGTPARKGARTGARVFATERLAGALVASVTYDISSAPIFWQTGNRSRRPVWRNCNLSFCGAGGF
jgi:hypothetical protein